MRISVTVVALLMVATGSGVATAAVPAVTEVRVWHSMEGVSADAFTDLTTRFNAEHKDVHVTLEFKGTPATTAAAIVTAVKAKDTPDLVELDDENDDALRGVTKPIFEILPLAKSPDFNFFLPNTVSFMKDSRGRVLAFPFKAAIPVYLYNRDAYVKVGLDPDVPPRTWRDLQKHLIALQAAGQGFDCAYTTSHQTIIHVADLASWHGETIATKNNGLEGAGATLTFNDLLHVRHFALMESWVRSKLFVVSGDGKQGDQRFAAGECATLTTDSDALGDILQTAKFSIGIAPLPFYEEGARQPVSPWLTGSALWALEGKKPEEYKAVAEFLAYLASPVPAATFSQRTGAVPITSAAFLASEKSAAYERTPGIATVMKQAASSPGVGQKGIALAHFDRVHKIIDSQLDFVWTGEKAAKQALDDAVRLGDEAMRESEPPKVKATKPRINKK